MESTCNVKFGIIICLIVFATIIVTVIVCAILFVLYAPNVQETEAPPKIDHPPEIDHLPKPEESECPTIEELEAELDGIGEEIMREKNEALMEDLKNRQFDDDVQDLEVSEEQSSVDRIVETQ
jgi:cell division protein FtsN